MKKLLYLSAAVLMLNACAEEKKESTETAPTVAADPAAAVAPVTATTPEEKPTVNFVYPIKYSAWEIGKPENINTVLKFYKAWDDHNPTEFENIFADSLRLRLPEEKEEFTLLKKDMKDVLLKNRNMYEETSNDILSAVSLHDQATGEDWVMITTYNKWKEKGGKRDALIYHDNWKLKDGKIYFLMSFEKKVTKQFIKRNDPAAMKK